MEKKMQRIVTAISYPFAENPLNFKKNIKSHSGRVFTVKHF